MLEIAIPASDHRGEIGNDPLHAVASRATGLFADLVLEPLQALFPHHAPPRFEPVATGALGAQIFCAMGD